MGRKEYERRTEELLSPIMESEHMEIVDVEFVKEAGNYYLRVYIDKAGGVNIDDCEKVSRLLETELDREDFISEAYILEVSSPGLGRALKKERDYVRNRGKKIEIHLFRPEDGTKEFAGMLTEWDDNTVTIVSDDEKAYTFEKKDISLIREYVEW